MNKANPVYIQRINKAIDYAIANMDKVIPLAELAGQAMFSPFHFHRIFRAVTGETVNEFTGRIRNEKAARLLRFSTLPVGGIALECGFSSTSTFSRVFSQYFGISPLAYRRGADIKNSKICKVSETLNGYHCSMTVEQLAEKFPIDIRRLPEQRIAYIRVTDGFSEGVVLGAFETLVKWAKANGLFDTEMIFGMSIDDPDVTPREKYRYEACITIPNSWPVAEQEPVETMVLPKCHYAVTTVHGDLTDVTAAMHYLIDRWLINSKYEHAHQHGLEVFLDKARILDWSHLDLELFVPIRPLKNIT